MFNTPTGFALSEDGSLYVCVDGSEVIGHDGSDDSPIWLTRLVGDIVGVAISGNRVWALQFDEVIVLTASGTRDIRISVPTGLRNITAYRDGVLVFSNVLSSNSMIAVAADGTIRDLNYRNASTAIGDEAGVLLAIDDTVECYGDDGTLNDSLSFDSPVRGIASAVEVFAIATTTAIHRWNTPWHTTIEVCRLDDGESDDDQIEAIAIHPGGGFAAVARPTRVVVYELSGGRRVADIAYPERRVNGLAWSGEGLLAIGLTGGDANLVDLDTHALRRSDTHPDRSHNSWIVEVGIDMPADLPAADEEVINGKSLDAFHAKLMATVDIEKRGRMLRNATVPDGIDELIDAGLRCIPLLGDPSIDDEPAKSAHARLNLILVRLRLKDPTIDVLRAVEEMEAAIKKEEADASQDVLFGCLFLLALVAVPAGILWWIFS